MIEKLCKGGGHPNIVVVLKHGWLNLNENYFVDMELCAINLEDYIRKDFKTVLGLSQYLDPLSATDEVGGWMSCLTLWGIMRQITSGLEFIHNHRELHRDLKPRNGKISRFHYYV